MENLGIEHRGGAILVEYSGEMTLDTTPDLRKEIEAATADGGFETLILDLSGVGFMDSSGIGFLVSLSSRVENEAKSFYLCRPSAQVSRTLDLVQLKKYFRVLSSEEERAPLML